MDHLRDLLVNGSEAVQLDVAALELATIEHPGSPVEPFVQLLDSHANELAERLDSNTSGEEFVELLTDYMVEELGFHGNEDNYYHPDNSCLNEVLAQRVGIPITLSIAYMEIARRLDRPIMGIGLPGHFLVEYNDGEYSSYIDPFHSGRLMTAEDCCELSREITGLDISNDPAALTPVSKRHILIRMLNNLRAVYFRRNEPAKAVKVLNLLIEADPSSAEEYKQRGICQAQIQSFDAAKLDLEMYLRLAPKAHDRKDVEDQIERMKKWLAAQ
jgi:regulator of sirC expression with transglutaminase-like and TPR domain